MSRTQQVLVWLVLGFIVALPIVLAARSPLLAWRDPIYIAAGFAGIFGLVILFIQPLLAGSHLPGLSGIAGRRVHRFVGFGLVSAVIIHVVALWITSPPDVIDVLLFVSPTPFSVWGAIAMWAVFATGLLVVLRKRMRLRLWRICHTLLAVIIVVGSVVHALLIEGTMEPLSKIALCALALLATAKIVFDLKAWALRRPASKD